MGGTGTGSGLFTSAAVPVVTVISPISGTNFLNATTVKFGNHNASGFTVNSATQIIVTLPAITVGTVVDITVTMPGGTNAISSAGQFTSTNSLSGFTGTLRTTGRAKVGNTLGLSDTGTSGCRL